MLLAAASLTALFTFTAPQQPPAAASPTAKALLNTPGARPRLVVVISIDQFRADYLTRLPDLFGEGGFKRLMTRGVWYPNAHHSHYPLFTGPGHAVLLTGAAPYKSGIVSNEWWDPINQRLVYSVEQAGLTVVGADPASKAQPMGPANLRSTTVGDELKLATNGQSRSVSIGLKDRAAILMAGHAADACLWFDTTGGRWISSSAYCRSGSLPRWAADLNAEAIPAQHLGETWACSLTTETLSQRTTKPSVTGSKLPEGFGAAFPHAVGKAPTPANFRAFAHTPAANAFVFETARRSVAAEHLGADAIPDLLTINLSTNDYVGHGFGPYSPEAVDLTVQTDAQLAAFLTYLDGQVGADKYTVVLTGDHGVAPIPEDAASADHNLPASRFSIGEVTTRIEAALDDRFGKPEGGTWFALAKGDTPSGQPIQGGRFLDGMIWLSDQAVRAALSADRRLSRRDIEQTACDAINSGAKGPIPGVYACYGRTQILEGRLGSTDIAHRLALATHPQVSADLVVLQEQLCLQDPMTEGHASSHGTPYAYDTHVPIIVYGPGVIKPGIHLQRVSTMDIAPTISLLVGVEFPSGNDGEPLSDALAQ